MTGDSTFGGYNHRWKFNADNTYDFYSPDGEDKWIEEKTDIHEYNVQGDWLAFRWGEEGKEDDIINY